RGIALDSLAGTLAVSKGGLRLYAGTAALAGGRFAAAGKLGGTTGVGVSLGGVSGARAGRVLPFEGGRIGAIGTLGGGAGGTRFTGGVVVDGAGIDRLPLAVSGEVRLAGTSLHLRSTDASVGTAVGWLDGSVEGFGSSAARYDVELHLTAARLAEFARAAAPERTDVAGTLAGDFHIAGTPGALALDGDLRVPEGRLNGLAFRDGATRLRLDSGGIEAHAGTLKIGSTEAAFEAEFRGNDASLRVDLPRADLSDFDDFFDAGDMLGGRGRIAGRFSKRANAEFTAADASVSALRYRRFDLGDARVGWTSQGANVRGAAAFGGASGRLEAAGTLVLARQAPLGALLSRSRFVGDAHLRGLDLGVWLPALGYQVPLEGRVDADATISGPLKKPDVKTRATLAGASFGRFPIERLTLAATSTLDRTTVTNAELTLPSLAATLSGSFGLRARDPVALAIHAKSPDVGTLAARAYGATTLAGAAEMDVKVTGTRASPRVAGGFDVENARLRGVAIPRALGEFTVRGRDLVLSGVEVGFTTGAVYFAGSVPLEIAPLGLGPSQAPITLELAAKGLDLGNFKPLLPSGSTLGGRIDGRVAVSGTAGAPRLDGRLDLADGAFRSPSETVPLMRLRAALRFDGNAARLEGLHAEAGGGTFDAAGSASLGNLGRLGLGGAFELTARAKRLRLNVPAYGSGQIDGAIALIHAASRAPTLTGRLALSDAVIPFSALLFSNGGAGPDSGGASGAAASSTADVALDLSLQAARNVRVRSANVDIGARGDVHVGGTRSSPELLGTFTSTGGTVSYFNTVFRLTEGSVAFVPERGLIPTLEAEATTHVIDADPNSVRNVSGAADITLAVSGPLTGLTIGLSSYPAYDREQILGLLLNAPALGATNLFGERAGPTPYGSNSPSPLLPGVVGRASGAQLSVAQEAFGIANAQFTRTLLAPIESSFATAVGLSSFNVNVGYTGNVDLTARKVLGRKLNALYGTSFGYPYRQTFGFEFKPSDAAAAQVTVFQTLGAAGLDSLAPVALAAPNQRLQAAQPATGAMGFSLSLQRLYP
ncbi:MAG: translocation/assembly module TamB domain-containing protein, partial [Candidatus Eremiobacteraeota bacterium]|nr:translocation/assembly module TamB domain-containing protein [Candidatus Eremiobacteraeota bacterium]